MTSRRPTRADESSRFLTPTMMSMTGFAASPGTAVLPMCSISSTQGPIAPSIRARSSSKSEGQASSYGTKITGSPLAMLLSVSRTNPYSGECVEGVFCEVRLDGVLRSSAQPQSPRFLPLSDQSFAPGVPGTVLLAPCRCNCHDVECCCVVVTLLADARHYALLVVGVSVELAQLGDVLVRAVAVDRDVRQLGLDRGELLLGQLDVGGAEVLLDPFRPERSRDGHDEVLLVQHPRQGDLRGGGTLLPREAGEQVQEGLVRPDVVLVEAGDDPPHVVAAVGVAGTGFAGQEAARKRAERDEADAELLTGGDDLPLEHPLHDRVLALDRRQRRDRVRAPDLLRAGLGLTPAQDLSLLDQLAHGLGDVLHRDRVRHPVLVVQLDVIGAQPTQGRLEVRPDLLSELAGDKRSRIMNLVAITTSSRTGANARPTSSSF